MAIHANSSEISFSKRDDLPYFRLRDTSPVTAQVCAACWEVRWRSDTANARPRTGNDRGAHPRVGADAS